MIRNTIRNTIQNTIRNTLGDDAFNMLDLFSGGQRGVWYDPSDLATMFQESTGGTVVTADGQPVGLMYDKSRGEIFGDVELVTNGAFDNGTIGWDANVSGIFAPPSRFEVVAGKLEVVGAVDNYGFFANATAIDVSSLNNATLTIDITKTGRTDVRVGTTKGSNDIFSKTVSSNGVGKSYTFNTSGVNEIYIGFVVQSSTTSTFDNISVREVLGTTATQPVATKRPTYKDTPDRLEIDLVDDALLFDVPVGGIDGYMVVGTNDGTASYGVSLPAGSYELGGDYFPSNTINGFLLREGAVSKSDLAKVEKDFVSKGAKASYGDVTNFSRFWQSKNITEFPLIDTSSGTSILGAWNTNNLTSFPLINTSNVSIFQGAWANNNLTSFPLIDTSSGTNFSYAWQNNSTLADFPANMFDNCLCTNFSFAFTNTGLSQSSIDNILISINSNGTSNGTFNQSGGSAPSAAGEAAIDGLVTRGWTVTVTGGYQGKVLPQALFENDENGFWYNMGIN